MLTLRYPRSGSIIPHLLRFTNRSPRTVGDRGIPPALEINLRRRSLDHICHSVGGGTLWSGDEAGVDQDTGVGIPTAGIEAAHPQPHRAPEHSPRLDDAVHRWRAHNFRERVSARRSRRWERDEVVADAKFRH